MAYDIALSTKTHDIVVDSGHYRDWETVAKFKHRTIA